MLAEPSSAPLQRRACGSLSSVISPQLLIETLEQGERQEQRALSPPSQLQHQLLAC